MHCGAFCQRKDESPEDRKKSNKFYRCKERDAELYEALTGIIARLITMDRLKEVVHSYDTNPNEAMNNLIAWIAPKNKHYSGSVPLQARVCVATCVQSMGFDSFFRQLLKRLDIAVKAGANYWLEQLSREVTKETASMGMAESALCVDEPLGFRFSEPCGCKTVPSVSCLS